ncbi:GmrSD restriction endonuclease domain-containing protein [Epilithonimonas hominis]|uniref:GmrSD restriction endonuclease domain-containing protein n=1 Tax=Epilithonimonas hominis TaxID=420404 RepID=UPI00289F5313|nr:DUF262 domain-containing protein [Epilithonimonas hominis]
MATLFKDVKYNLNSLIQNIDLGTIGLPDIQRPFVWKDTKVRDLFDSLYKGYPVGYFLFWENANIDGVKGIGTDVKQKFANLLIVDGQQRLTSLYAVLKGQEVIRENYEKTKIIIAFNPIENKFEVPDAAIRRSPRYYQNISNLWKPNINIFKVIMDFVSNLKNHIVVTDELEMKIQEAFMKLKNLENYPFSVLELSQEIDEEQVADVFVRINSEGKTLNQADFILTLMSVFWDEGRTNLENFCRDARIPSTTNATPFNYLIVPKPEQMLRAAVGLAFRRARLQYIYSILRGKDLETGLYSEERREQQFEKLKIAQAQALDITNWHEFIKAVKQAGYINESFISSNNNILYSYVFFLMGRIDYKVDLYQLKQLIAKWFFMCSITGRYTGSPETAMEMDLAKFRTVGNAEDFVKEMTTIIESQLTSDFWNVTLPMDLATSSFRSPSLFAYYASLNIHNALGLFSKLQVKELLESGLRANKSALERHHLFPKAWLIRNGITEQRDYNQIANFALVEWSDNIAISDKEPKVYLPIYEQRFANDELEKMRYWHALPEDWIDLDYRDFLNQRRKMIAKVVEAAFSKL